jgi:hypothetical protein
MAEPARRCHGTNHLLIKQQDTGTSDWILRIVLAAVILGVLLRQQITGTPLLLWLLVGTGVAGYCPLYALLGISPRRVLPN